MISVLRDAHKSLVITSSKEISKQQHCKNESKMSTDLNIEVVTKFVEQKLWKKPVDNLLGEPTYVTYGILED